MIDIFFQCWCYSIRNVYSLSCQTPFCQIAIPLQSKTLLVIPGQVEPLLLGRSWSDKLRDTSFGEIPYFGVYHCTQSLNSIVALTTMMLALELLEIFTKEPVKYFLLKSFFFLSVLQNVPEGLFTYNWRRMNLIALSYSQPSKPFVFFFKSNLELT